MKKRKKGSLLTYILAALGGGILIGAALLWFFTDSNMYKTGYVPMSTVMKKAGYAPVSTQDAAVCYGDTLSDTLLRVEYDYRTVTKDDFVYSEEDAFSIALKKLYVRRTFIEQVLDISVSRSYPFGYNVTVHPPVTGADLTNMAVPFIAHAGGGSVARNEEGVWEEIDLRPDIAWDAEVFKLEAGGTLSATAPIDCFELTFTPGKYRITQHLIEDRPRADDDDSLYTKTVAFEFTIK